MFKIDTETNAITLPHGDTMAFTLTLTSGGEPAEFPEGTAAVFGICQTRTSGAYKYIFEKNAELTGNVVTVTLTNADTRDIKPRADYAWDVRIVTDPEYDENGQVRCDDASDSVTSVFAGTGSLPKFELVGVSAYV